LTLLTQRYLPLSFTGGGGEKEKEQGEKLDFVNNENLSKHEDRILVDNETGREDEMEEEIETVTEWPEDAEVRPKYDFFSSPAYREIEEKHIPGIQGIIPSASIDRIRAQLRAEYENKTDISLTQEDQEDVQPVRTVRVPAHQVSDRKFVKIKRKRRKRKEQTDCKAS